MIWTLLEALMETESMRRAAQKHRATHFTMASQQRFVQEVKNLFWEKETKSSTPERATSMKSWQLALKASETAVLAAELIQSFISWDTDGIFQLSDIKDFSFFSFFFFGERICSKNSSLCIWKSLGAATGAWRAHSSRWLCKGARRVTAIQTISTTRWHLLFVVSLCFNEKQLRDLHKEKKK